MSNALITAAYTKAVPPKYQHVLVLLCDMANDNGVCWPSIDRIAWKLGSNRRTVMRAVKGLEADGIIEVHRRHRKVNVYVIHLDRAADKEPYRPTQDDNVLDALRALGDKSDQNEDKMSPKDVQNVTQQGGNLSPQPKEEPSVEPKENQRVTKSRRKPECPIPDDFTLTADLLAYAIDKGMDDQRAHIQFERMRNWAISKDERKRDWVAAWRNWVLGDIERNGKSTERRRTADAKGGLVYG